MWHGAPAPSFHRGQLANQHRRKPGKSPRVNPANYWSKRQTQPTDSMEEEEEKEKVSEDDISTDELEGKADSSEENN